MAEKEIEEKTDKKSDLSVKKAKVIFEGIKAPVGAVISPEFSRLHSHLQE